MARPKKLKIGLYTYPVKWCKTCVTPEGDEVQGYIHYVNGKKVISVGTEDCSGEPAEILLHEVTHGICQDRSLDKLFASDGDEEMFVSSFAKGLLAVLRENKGLAEWVSQ